MIDQNEWNRHLLSRMQARCRKTIKELRQLVRDIESWNDNNPQHTPIDCEPERVCLDHAVKYLSQLQREYENPTGHISDEHTKGMIRALKDEGSRFDDRRTAS